MLTHSLAEDAGQMLLVGFDGLTLPSHVASALRDGQIGGTILFRRNIDTIEQVADLTGAIQDAVGESQPLPFISVDQEGGRVQRLREPLTVVPPMLQVGQTGDPDLVARIGALMGEELEALGFNLDYAPCVDVWTNPLNTVIGDRAFGRDVETVSRMAGAFQWGLIQAGLVPCAKHFPGHGDTELDSHHALPVISHPLERLQQVELEPFRRLIRAEVPMIMTAHVLVPAVDDRRPATLSNAWITGTLRRAMKFGGVIISDDLEMKAVADRYPVEELVERGLHAGLDILMFCHTHERWALAHETLIHLGERSNTERQEIAMAAGRVRNLKQNWLRRWTRPDDLRARVGTSAHEALVAQVLERAQAAAATTAADATQDLVDPTDPNAPLRTRS